VVAFTGLDFMGGGFKNSAATIFVTPEALERAQRAGTQRAGRRVVRQDGGIKEALVLAFAPPAIFGLGSTGGFEFYIQNKGEGGAQENGGSERRLSWARRTRIFATVA
jgi:multidrug efflux pump